MITETTLTLIIRSYFFEKYFSWHEDNLRLEIRAPEEKKIVPIMDKSKKF